MLQVGEFLDMEAVEALRAASLGRGLDEHDNFSWHIALTDDGKLLGTGRLYRQGEGVLLDCVALADPLAEAHREMIFRTLLLKATLLKSPKIFALPEAEDSFYTKFGFVREGELFSVSLDRLVFPKQCKECSKC